MKRETSAYVVWLFGNVAPITAVPVSRATTIPAKRSIKVKRFLEESSVHEGFSKTDLKHITSKVKTGLKDGVITEATGIRKKAFNVGFLSSQT